MVAEEGTMLISEYYENLSFSHGLMMNISYVNIPTDFPLHWHTFAEIMICFEGSFELGLGHDIYQMEKLDVAICYPGVLHSIKSKGCKKDFLILQFPFELITNMNEFNRMTYLFSGMKIIRANESKELAIKMKDILVHMKDVYYSDLPFKEVILYTDLLSLFTQLGNWCLREMKDATLDSGSTKSIDLIAEACLFIARNCTEPIELETVAKHVGFSKYHFAHTFKKYVNMTFLEFLTTERIKKAETLLADPHISITEIALRTGYTNFSTFNRTFKRNKGCTPSEFRNKVAR